MRQLAPCSALSRSCWCRASEQSLCARQSSLTDACFRLNDSRDKTFTGQRVTWSKHSLRTFNGWMQETQKHLEGSTKSLHAHAREVRGAPLAKGINSEAVLHVHAANLELSSPADILNFICTAPGTHLERNRHSRGVGAEGVDLSGACENAVRAL
jgi:hypothetical protein